MKCKYYFRFFYDFLEGPVTVSEDRNHLTVGTMRVDVHAVTADDEVYMDHGVIDAKGLAFLVGFVMVVTDGIVEASAYSQVADRVLVKEGVVEQQISLIDGTGLGY